MGALEVAKVNKRLVIREQASKRVVYVAPDFLKPVVGRGVFARLAVQLEQGLGIDAIMTFETAHNRRALSRPVTKEA